MLTRLKYERLRRGIRQNDLALAARVHQGDLGKIERGQYVPPVGSVVLARVARVLDTPAEELLKPVEMMQAAPEPPPPVPIPVPPIPVFPIVPTARQLAAQRRCAAEMAELEAKLLDSQAELAAEVKS